MGKKRRKNGVSGNPLMVNQLVKIYTKVKKAFSLALAQMKCFDFGTLRIGKLK